MYLLKPFSISLACIATAGFAAAQTGNGLAVDLDLGEWRLEPYAEIVVGYDTDIFLADDLGEESDAFASLRLGLKHQKRLGAVYLKGDAYYRIERWRDTPEADDDDVGFDVDIGAAGSREIGNRETIALYFDIAYEDGESLDYETGEVESAQSFGLGAGAGKTMSRLDFDLMYDYRTTSYGESSRTFAKKVEFVDSRVLFNYNTHTTTAKAALSREGGGSSLIVLGQYGLQSSDGLEDDASFYAFRGGMAYRFSENTSGEATIGYIDHQDADEQTISYSVKGSWVATDKISFRVHGDSSIRPSVTDAETFNTIYELGGGIRYLITDKVAANLKVDYRDYESNRPVVRRSGAITQGILPAQASENDTFSTSLQLAWAPPLEGYSVFAEAMHEKRTSSIATNEYDRYLFQTGLIIYY